MTGNAADFTQHDEIEFEDSIGDLSLSSLLDEVRNEIPETQEAPATTPVKIKRNRRKL